LAGLPGNKFLIKKPVSTVFQNENFYTFFMKKYTYLLYYVFNWVPPGQSTAS